MQINMPQIQQSTSQQQQDPLHPQQLVQVLLSCLLTRISFRNTFYFVFAKNIFSSSFYLFAFFLCMTVCKLYFRIIGKGKGLHLQELPTVLVQEILSALLILNHQLHLLILLVMELLWRVTCRILLVYPKV